MYCAIGSPWSPATPGAKYWGAFIPPDAVSIGTPGIEIDCWARGSCPLPCTVQSARHGPRLLRVRSIGALLYHPMRFRSEHPESRSVLQDVQGLRPALLPSL